MLPQWLGSSTHIELRYFSPKIHRQILFFQITSHIEIYIHSPFSFFFSWPWGPYMCFISISIRLISILNIIIWVAMCLPSLMISENICLCLVSLTNHKNNRGYHGGDLEAWNEQAPSWDVFFFWKCPDKKSCKSLFSRHRTNYRFFSIKLWPKNTPRIFLELESALKTFIEKVRARIGKVHRNRFFIFMFLLFYMQEKCAFDDLFPTPE